jgi:5'-nucleotidase
LLIAAPTHAGEDAAANDPPVIISIVGTNDLHGHIEALPHLGGYLANLRRARARDGGGVLLLDAGDMFQGTLESNLNEGAAVVRAYNTLGYDAAAIGNHDFDFGPVGPAPGPRTPADDPRGALKARAAEARFPFLAANISDTTTGAAPRWQNVRGTTIVSVAGVKVGVIGLANVGTAAMTLPANFAGLRTSALAPIVIAAARDLRRTGVTVVVVVAHVGGTCKQFAAPDDLSSCEADGEIFQLARALPAGTVDAIVAGHVHSAIAHRVAGIPIIESYSNGRDFGRIDLSVDLFRKRARSKVLPVVRGARLFPPQELPMPGQPFAGSYEGAPLEPDRTVEAAVAPALAAARGKREQKLGVSIARPIAPAYAAESALGNLFADLMRAAHPGADVAVINGGALRAELPAGALTYGQLHEALPFDDRFATFSISGDELAATISRNLGRAGGVVVVSGVRARADCRDGTLRVTLARADGAPIAGQERLTLVTNEFLATGGADLFSAEVRAHAAPATGLPVRDVMADLLRTRKAPIDPGDPPLYDAAQPRLRYPGRRPIRCR